MLSLPIKITLNTVRDFDPTRTLVLRGQFVAQVNKRFRDLKGAIIRLLTKDNFLEPVKPTKYQPGIIPIALAVKYEYLRSDIKVEQFMGWLQDQEKQGILQIFQRPGGLRRGQSQAWTDTYIQSSYQRGIVQARADLRKAGADIPSFQQIPGGVSAVFNQPFHADRVALIYTRCFNGMKGITGAMNGHLSRELALGMAEGQSPYAIARRINEKVDTIGVVRGRLIAKTEIVQSHNEAALNEYKRAEIEIGEPVLAEWIAVMDSRTRPPHAERHGNVYELSEAQEMLGEPNCRCGLAPWVKSLQKKVPVEKIAEKFVSAKTVKEAAEEFKKYSNVPVTGMEVWNEQKKLKVMNIVNHQMYDMQKWTKGRKLGQFGFADGDAQWNGRINVRIPLATNNLRLNNRIRFLDPTKAEPLYGSLNSGRWTISGNSAGITVRHEMGHGMWFDVPMSNLEVRGNFTKRFLALDKKLIERNVSKYAATNSTEFFAECFTIYSSPEYVAGTLNGVFGKGFEELMEKILISGVK